LLRPVLNGDDERLAVGTLQDFRPPKRPVRLAVQNLEQTRHLLLHAGVRSGKNVALTVAIDVHKLWSGASASPHPGHFRHPAFRLQPDAPRELPLAQILEDPDLSLIELSDEQILFAIAVNVGPTRRRVARAFNADGDPVRFQTHRTFEFRSAAPGRAAEEQKRWEQ
jgi:hypothetical protein